MPEITVAQKMSSTWPDKLRAMDVNDVLLISHEDLTRPQIISLVRNFEHRQKKNILYNIVYDESDDALITCVYRNKRADISKKPPGFNQPRIKEKLKAGRAAVAPIRAEALLHAVANDGYKRIMNSVERLAEGEVPTGVVDVTYADNTTKLIFIKDAEHHGHVLNRLMKEGNAVMVQTFAAGKTIKRKTTWEG